MQPVTKRMLEAGAAIIADRYDQLGDGVDELRAKEIFEAMIEASDEGYRLPSKAISVDMDD